MDQRTYTVYIGRGTTAVGGWKAADDLDTLRAAGNVSPGDIWSDGTTVWVVDAFDVDKLYAYTLAGGARDQSKDIALHADNADPFGIWSDGTTIWVVDFTDKKLYAYTLAGGARDEGKEFALHAHHVYPTEIWSDGTTIWVTDRVEKKLYAYTLASGARDQDKEFALHADNTNPRGLWSDGAAIWVSDPGDDKLYAYTLAGGARVQDDDIDLNSSNAGARGVWSDGDTMWVANRSVDFSSAFNRVFSYNMPSGDLLSSLAVSPTNINGFDWEVHEYMVGVGAGVEEAQITPTAYDSGATVTVGGTAVASGSAHTVSLATGLNTFRVVVTAPDGIDQRIYTVRIGGARRRAPPGGRRPTTWTR